MWGKVQITTKCICRLPYSMTFSKSPKTFSKSPKYNSLLKFSGVRYLPFPVCIPIMLPTVSAIA